jgi:hypothetical protein
MGGDLLAGLVVGCGRVRGVGPARRSWPAWCAARAPRRRAARGSGNCVELGGKAVAARDAAAALTALRDVAPERPPISPSSISTCPAWTDWSWRAAALRPAAAGVPLVLLGAAPGDRAPRPQAVRRAPAARAD